MKTSQAGLDFIERFEGLKLTAYQCPAGIWTIGYGHTGGVQPNTTITAATAAQYLAEDVTGAELAVERFVLPHIHLAQGQFDALVSLVYNIGAGAFHSSTLLLLLNQGRYDEAANQFLVWDHVGGVVSPGLLRRRMAEHAMFIGPPPDGPGGDTGQ